MSILFLTYDQYNLRMRSITHTDISKNLEELIKLKGELSRKEIERMTERAGTKVTSTTLGNFINDPELRSPWIKTIIALAYVLKVEPWALMIKNSPLDQVTKHPIEKISPEGYLLLYAFENATESAKYSMMDAAAIILSNTNSKTFHEIKDAQTRYSQSK